MGMFDNLHINTEKLPVSDEEKKLIGKNIIWQTKDFDCTLTDIHITDDNELTIRRFEHGWDETQKNGFGTMGVLIEQNVRTEIIPYNGFVNFYTNIESDWYEFFAKFTNGKLESIEGGKEK